MFGVMKKCSATRSFSSPRMVLKHHAELALAIEPSRDSPAASRLKNTYVCNP